MIFLDSKIVEVGNNRSEAEWSNHEQVEIFMET